MTRRPTAIPTRALAFLLALGALAAAAAAEPTFKLVDRRLDVRAIELAGMTDRELTHVVRTGAEPAWPRLPVRSCIAMWRLGPGPTPEPTGVVTLADGQRLPGRAMSGAPAAAEVLAWMHPRFGRLEIPLRAVRTVVFQPGAPRPDMTGADADVLLLANGARVEGFITALGDPISIEVRDVETGETTAIDIPLERAAAASMVTPDRDADEWRVWLSDGSVLDVSSLVIGDDGLVRVGGSGLLSLGPQELEMAELRAVLFDRESMRPLAALEPSRVTGPPTRYRVPDPRRTDERAPLGLSGIELSGPIVVHYALPAGATRFAATAVLPASCQAWGDCELVVRDDDREVFRVRLDRDHAAAEINVALDGSELTLEVLAGANGPVQDRVVLTEAMLLLAVD